MNAAPHHHRAVLALDPGGSKCEALIVGADGSILGAGREHRPGLSGRSLEVVVLTVRAALGTNSFDELHIATGGKPWPPDAFGLPATTRLTIDSVSETDSALALIDSRAGICVVAGTGARVEGRLADGSELSLDGVGPMLGDHGSGYQIGLQALRAVARAWQHPRHQTSLSEPIFTACEEYIRQLPDSPPPRRRPEVTGQLARRMIQKANKRKPDPLTKRLWNVVKFSLTPLDRSVVASLSRIVDVEARRGDAVARRILLEAAADLAETVRDVVLRLNVGALELPLVGIGSVILQSDIYWEEFRRLVSEIAPLVRAQRATLPPVVGTASLMLRQIPDVDYATARTRLWTAAQAHYKQATSSS